MKLRTFKLGGVHPKENKLSAKEKIKVFPIPKRVYIPVSQHLGAPSTLLVKKGDTVKTGQLIAKSQAFICANNHSSVSGKVKKIDNIIDASGYKKTTVVIDVEGDEWEENIDRTTDIKREITLASKEIISKVKEMGIVGLGGATFPSHVKLMVPEGKKADYMIINGAECEPYLTSDHSLMLEKGEEIMIGACILMKALNVKKTLIGIESNKKDVIEHFTELSKKFEGIKVHPLKVKYPQGGEKQLIKALVNREVPSCKLPVEVGCVVNNVGTAFAVYEAVQKNKPLFERVVTVTGKSVKNSSNFLVRLGTSVSELIDAVGGLPEDTGKVISGGPMMGKALASLDTPVVKGTSGIVLMSISETKRQEEQNCIRCGKCAESCPMGLEPFLLADFAEKKDFETLEKYNMMDCIECGACQFICPANRPLLDYLRIGKNKVGQIIRNRNKR
jgi:electron transport complex protein RnfC